jgi:hypothetical protein
MNAAIAMLVQLALVVLPVAAMMLVKKKTEEKRPRIIAAVVLAAVFSGIAWYLAAYHHWRPHTRSGPADNLSAITIGAITVPGLLFALVVFALAKPKKGARPGMMK